MRVDATEKPRREKEMADRPNSPRLLAIRRSPRNRISIGTVITELRFGFVVILNDLFAHGHLLHPPLRQEESSAIIIMANSRTPVPAIARPYLFPPFSNASSLPRLGLSLLPRFCSPLVFRSLLFVFRSS